MSLIKKVIVMKTTKKTLLAAFALSIFASASPVAAAVVIEQSPSFVQPDENVQLDTDVTPGDNTIRGTTNQTKSKVVFTSMSDNLASAPQGQAEITPIGAGASDGLNNLTFRLENLSTFTQAEFNIIASVGGTVRISAFDAANALISNLDASIIAGQVFGEEFTVGTSGQNFFGIRADNSTPITSVRIEALGNTRISSIGQFRVEGLSAVGAVPEPSTWMLMLLGMAGIGFSMRRKEKQTLRVRFA